VALVCRFFAYLQTELWLWSYYWIFKQIALWPNQIHLACDFCGPKVLLAQKIFLYYKISEGLYGKYKIILIIRLARFSSEKKWIDWEIHVQSNWFYWHFCEALFFYLILEKSWPEQSVPDNKNISSPINQCHVSPLIVQTLGQVSI